MQDRHLILAFMFVLFSIVAGFTTEAVVSKWAIVKLVEQGATAIDAACAIDMTQTRRPTCF